MTKRIIQENDTWEIGGKTLSSRLLIGSALYPSPANMEDAIKNYKTKGINLSKILFKPDVTESTSIKNNSNKSYMYGEIPNTLKQDDIKYIKRIKAKL